MPFPKNFVWGAAAASYQVEGGFDADGRGPSVWDMFCRWDGKTYLGQTGDVACDHYHRYRQDVALMKQVGLQAYRLSISWSRVLPEGTGEVNEKGLEFYDRLIDALLEAKITPWVTLFHWDYPLALYHRGGWLNRETVQWFGDYTQVVIDRLSDRVVNWMTHNETLCFLGLGHGSGVHAPGLKLSLSDQLLATHHTLMAHGRSVQVIRQRAKLKPQISWAPVGTVSYPATDSPADIAAAREASFAWTRRDLIGLTWYSDPLIKGGYPEDALQVFGADVPKIHPGDMELMKQPLDFFGINLYHGPAVRAGKDGKAEKVAEAEGREFTFIHWPVEPMSLYWTARFHFERYGLPIVITENGLSNQDWVTPDGKVHDPQRIEFLRRYLAALEKAIDDGVDVRGYFQWSIMDNFEWAQGYRHRFGLIHVDYPTQKRTLKDSAHWYRRVIETNGASVHEQA